VCLIFKVIRYRHLEYFLSIGRVPEEHIFLIRESSVSVVAVCEKLSRLMQC
jgi:hypothetical protein